MALKLNEVAISKACSVKLDDETIAIVSLMYHTAAKENKETDHSWYQYEGRVVKIADLKAEIDDMKADANRLNLWRWPNKSWPADWFMGYDNSNENKKGARWYEMKMRKALDWEQYVKLVKEGIKRLGNGSEKQYPTGRYETDDYVDSDGNIFSIVDKDALIARVGKTFTKKLVLKRSLPKANG